MRATGQWRELARDLADRTGIIARFLCLCHVTANYLCTPTLVYGPSMLPTLNLTGDVVLTERVSTWMGTVRVGDLVALRSPDNPTRMVTKRVLGVEGDTVTFSVNPNFDDRSSCTVLVPRGHVWIQGDNIYASKDSRHYGPVPCGLIQGKVCFRVWPLDGFGFLE